MWFAMHELGHLLWDEHDPLRQKRFREEFGKPRPANYDGLNAAEVWKTMVAWRLSWYPGLRRPKGEPSLGMARGAAGRSASLWDTCWKHGLSRMT